MTIKNDERILPLGSYLRKTNINELQQLINVLYGEMSIIGPRTQTQRCFNAFPEQSKDLIIRLKTGLSGIGSSQFEMETNVINQKKIYLKFII